MTKLCNMIGAFADGGSPQVGVSTSSQEKVRLIYSWHIRPRPQLIRILLYPQRPGWESNLRPFENHPNALQTDLRGQVGSGNLSFIKLATITHIRRDKLQISSSCQLKI